MPECSACAAFGELPSTLAQAVTESAPPAGLDVSLTYLMRRVYVGAMGGAMVL